jgi:hypothetical protein
VEACLAFKDEILHGGSIHGHHHDPRICPSELVHKNFLDEFLSKLFPLAKSTLTSEMVLEIKSSALADPLPDND